MFVDVVLNIHCPCSGLFAFASTTLVLSLYNVQARHITVLNVIVGMALFYGGLAQFLMWELAMNYEIRLASSTTAAHRC
jgi:succinate-acetate transporter protein